MHHMMGDLDLRVLKAALQLNSTSVGLISEVTGLSKQIVRDSLESLGLESVEGDVRSSLVEATLRWVERARAFEEASRALTWELYEALVSGILERAGFFVVKNLRVVIGRRRAQIDVAALSGSALYVFECKRWMRSLTGKMAMNEAKKLKRRTELLCEALKSLLGDGTYTYCVVPILVSPYVAPGIGDAFIAPLRSLLSLLSSHPSTLPSPPAFKIQLGRELTPDLLKKLRSS